MNQKNIYLTKILIQNGNITKILLKIFKFIITLIYLVIISIGAGFKGLIMLQNYIKQHSILLKEI